MFDRLHKQCLRVCMVQLTISKVQSAIPARLRRRMQNTRRSLHVYEFLWEEADN